MMIQKLKKILRKILKKSTFDLSHKKMGKLLIFEKTSKLNYKKIYKFMKKKLPSQIRQIIEECKEANHRGIFVIMGDRAKD